MEKLTTQIKINEEFHNRIPADIREQGVKSQIIQGIAKKIVDDNLISITETKEYGHTSYEVSFLIMQEADYHNLVNEFFKLKRTLMNNSDYPYTFKKQMEQIKELLKIK